MEQLSTSPAPLPIGNQFPFKKIVLFGVIFLSAILPVIFFVASLRSTNSDITRIAHISVINERISDALRRGINIPLPTQALEISYGELKMGYQGRAGKDLFLALGIEYLTDPGSGEMYHYFIRPETQEYELIALLDDTQYSNFEIGEKPAYTQGSSKGHMLIINTGKNKGKLVSSIITSSQKVDLSDSVKRNQIGWQSEKSCQGILKKYPNSTSGKYIIEIESTITTVYCDMKTAGGGWTLFYANNGHPNSPVKLSYTEMREKLAEEPVGKIADYDDPNLAGLIDYNIFTSIGAREILIRNRTGDPTKWIQFSFNTPGVLNWALGDRVLGKGKKGCSKIPGGGSMNITSQDEKIKYDNLSSIMNHTGTSWGVSHENYWCNEYVGNANPHLAFYSATDANDSGRVRSSDGVGGAWGGENEYRYFIR